VAAFAGRPNPVAMATLARVNPSPTMMRFMVILSVVLGVADPDPGRT
jgi:hypothetical protein